MTITKHIESSSIFIAYYSQQQLKYNIHIMSTTRHTHVNYCTPSMHLRTFCCLEIQSDRAVVLDAKYSVERDAGKVVDANHVCTDDETRPVVPLTRDCV